MFGVFGTILAVLQEACHRCGMDLAVVASIVPEIVWHESCSKHYRTGADGITKKS